MPLQADTIQDLVATTLKDLGEMHWTDLASSLQEYVGLEQLLDKNKVAFQSGYGIQFDVQVAFDTNFRMTGLYAVDQINVVDGLVQATVPWRHSVWGYGIDRREISMNREPRRIVNILKERRAMSFGRAAEAIELQIWSQPTSSVDTTNVFGIPAWIVPNSTAGFFGANPFGFASGIGGLSSSTYANWANYTDQYVDVTKSDLIRKMRKASEFTFFKSPKSAGIPQWGSPKRSEYGYYTTNFVKSRMEEAGEAQNDNLGNDVASKDGEILFRRNPIQWVPQLDALSGTGAATASGQFVNATYTASGGYALNPVFGINWSKLRPIFLEGEYMKEQGPNPAPAQHTVMQVFVDMTWNLECRDRRHQFVMTQ